MALDTELRATTYAGNGSTALAYPILFPYLDSADIKVQVQAAGAATPTVLTESAYTVHDEEDDGAPYVTTTAAYPSTTTVQIFRFMDYLQPVVLPEGGKLSSVIIEQALDRVTMLAMQGGDGGYTLPSAGSRDSVVFADAGARATTVAARVGQLGVQTDNGSVWRALSTFAGDWQEIMPAIRSNERNVHTQSQLIAAFTDTAALTIYVRKDIDLSVSMTMGPNKTLVMGDYRFTQVGASNLILMGVVVADRKQIFSGFTAGQVSGSFGQEAVFPEWWGLVDNEHDVAINCAVQASRLTGSQIGLKVSLAPRVYDVSAPIDLSGKAITLEGAGSMLTYLRATTAWTPTWIKAEVWGAAGDPANHAALVWMGSNLDQGSNSSYWTKVKGMTLQCYNASFTHRSGGLLRVSGISSKGFVEECSVITDIIVTDASGFGIGFCRHKSTGGSFSAAVINGLDISSCWITGATFSDFYGMYFSGWTNNCSVRNVTVDVGLAKSVSSLHATGGAPGGADTGVSPTNWPVPTWICTYPHTAIYAAGYITLTDIHIEGAVIGIFIPEIGGASNVVATNIKAYAMMDRARSAVYELDGLSGANPPSNTDYYGYGAAVLIAGASETLANPTINFKGCATLTAVSTNGTCCYLVRDAAYGINRSMFGMGQFPAGDLGGRFSFYTRGNIYARSTTSPYALIGGGTYDPANPTISPSNTRTFFVGPIF